MSRSIHTLLVFLLLTLASVVIAQTPQGGNGPVSKTTEVESSVPACGLLSRFDEYGDLKFADEKARLDNFAIQITQEPLLMGFILMSAGQVTFENEAAERLDRARSYLANVRKVDSNRIVTIDCGFTPDLTIQLYIGPFGLTPPCNTYASLPLSEVKLTKPRPKAAKRKR